MFATLLLSAAFLLPRQDAGAKTPAKTSADVPPVVAAPASPLDRFKAMKGSWEADLDGDGASDTVVEYRSIAGGSSVVETLFPLTDDEMVTVYHMDGAQLMCTHYCAAGNQPRLHAKAATQENDKSERVEFVFKDITNLATPQSLYMNSVTFVFAADGTVQSTWSSIADGKPGHSAVFRMKRKA